ncbi:hypothetical protein [Hymenobacter lapidiphilus]|uniref:hypothetical protein n=1 Tax=Hymenobacter sp. CCM 8763 TaxID=2303334 RepID=UPI00167EF2BF|nr:hypothetical protein [Hymenobacter sp. CCM 8763]
MKNLLLLARLRGSMLRLFRRPKVMRGIAWLLLVALLPLHLSCSYYYTRNQAVTAPTLTTLADSKVFVVHQGAETWQLVSPRFNGEVLEGVKAAPYMQLAQHSQPPVGGTSARYNVLDKNVVLNVVHLYISEHQESPGQLVRIPLAAVQRLDLVEKDTGRTTASYLLVGLGIAAAVFVIVGIIALLLKSSCPFVYAYDGQNYHFVGEAYGGAIFAPLERDDYLPLPGIEPQSQQYRLKLTNELRERQYTNLAELWVVAHPANTQVLLDQHGGVHTVARPQLAISAVSLAGADCAQQLAAADHNAFLFNEELAGTAVRNITLAFARPAAARTAKLVLRAKNSLWLDYLYGEFAKKFGSYYTHWASREKQLPAATINQWMRDQGMPLKVYVATTQGWRLVENIPLVGPLAARDLVVPLDLTNVPPGPVRVKLEAGFMFWEVDYAALDATPDQPFTLEKCRPQTALDEHGLDQAGNLAADDAQYLQQPHPGMEVTLSYQSRLEAPTTQPGRSVFLRTKGYYEHIRHYEGLPNLPELYGFRKPGRFMEFSQERYYETARQLNLTALNR